MMAVPGLRRPVFICDNERLVADASNSIFAIRNKITPAGIRHLWNGLSNFINVSLKSHKGVLLPALGQFIVGQALEDRYETYKRYRPTFSLLDGRFGGVSQERSKYRLLNRAGVVQLNYQLIAKDANIHRSIAQRIIAEILQRLAMHIVAGHPIKVSFPSVGQLVRNRAGRIEFLFDHDLIEPLELGLGPGTPCWSMGYELPRASAMDTAAATAGTTAAVAPVATSAVLNQPSASPQSQQQQLYMQQPSSAQQQQQVLVGASAAGSPVQLRPLSPSPQQVHQYIESLQTLMKLCKQCDRTSVGAVPRAQLETWMQTHCRPLLTAVDGATMLDMLLQHTFGTTGRFVQYNSFLQDLEDFVMMGTQTQSASVAAGPAAMEAAAAAAYPSAAASPIPGAAPARPAKQQQPSLWQAVQEQQWQEGQQLLQEQERQQLRRPSVPALDLALPPVAELVETPLAAAGQRQVAAAPDRLQLFEADGDCAAAGAGAVTAELSGPEPVPLNHYLQNLISPRSRSEYDEFNRYHFSRLKQQGRDKRAVTPKVGEDPMNRCEVAALKAELCSPRLSAEVAIRARSPEVVRPTNTVDTVADILQLEGRPHSRAAVQERLLPVLPADQDFGRLSLYGGRPGSKGVRAMGASYDYGSRDHIFEQGLM